METLSNEEIAYQEGLDLVHTTTSPVGYPSCVGTAITGFDDFEQAEAMADQYGKRIVLLRQKAGWQLWYNNWCQLTEAPCLEAEDVGYHREYSNDTSEEELIAHLIGEIGGLKYLEDIVELSEAMLSLNRDLQSLDEDEVIFAERDDNYLAYEVFKKYPTKWDYDSNYFIIAIC